MMTSQPTAPSPSGPLVKYALAVPTAKTISAAVVIAAESFTLVPLHPEHGSDEVHDRC